LLIEKHFLDVLAEKRFLPPRSAQSQRAECYLARWRTEVRRLHLAQGEVRRELPFI
jgi:hypothetical protein